MSPGILIVGTADTKADELLFMKQCVEEGGGRAAIMDVGVLGKPRFAPEFPNTVVAAAAGTTIEAIAALGDENAAMTKRAPTALAARTWARSRSVSTSAISGDCAATMVPSGRCALEHSHDPGNISTTSGLPARPNASASAALVQAPEPGWTIGPSGPPCG